MKLRLRSGVGTIELRFLVEDMDRHGNVRLYVRRKGRPKVRLRETPGTDAFLEEYRRALDAVPVPAARARGGAAAGSFRGLVEGYYASAEFRGLDARTRAVRRGLLDGLSELHGAKPFALMEPRHVRKIRDDHAEHSEAANARVKALRRVFAWAVEAGRASANPARDVPYLKARNPDGFHAWTVEEVARFEARHAVGTKARLALALLLYTGVRRSDVVALGRQMEAGGWLRFTEAKGRGRHPKAREIPILSELRAVIEATPSGHLTYLVTEFGKPFTPAGFGNWFRRRCNEAGLPGCSAHGLRKAGATIAANNGATEHQLMAIFGWASPKQAALYTRYADRKRLAADAMHLLAPERNPNLGVPLPPAVSASGTIRAKKP